MAAKKAPAKKMAAPKPAPKKMSAPKASASKKSGTADSSKLTAAQKKALAASAKNRTDVLGNQGLGKNILTPNEVFKLATEAASQSWLDGGANRPLSANEYFKTATRAQKIFEKSIVGNAPYTLRTGKDENLTGQDLYKRSWIKNQNKKPKKKK